MSTDQDSLNYGYGENDDNVLKSKPMLSQNYEYDSEPKLPNKSYQYPVTTSQIECVFGRKGIIEAKSSDYSKYYQGLSATLTEFSKLILLPNSQGYLTWDGVTLAITSSGQAGSGTVTSVALNTPNNFTVTGSPVTGFGSLSFAWNGSSANFVLADGSNVPTSTFALASALSNYATTASLASYQPLDADLTAIAGLGGLSGLLRKTASNTWSLDTTAYLTPTSNAATASKLLSPVLINNTVFDGSSSISFNTDNVLEGSTNQYFTQSRVLGTSLTGYSLGSNTTILATDTLIAAFGKIQSQINNTQPSNAILQSISNLSQSQTGLMKLTNGVTSLDSNVYALSSALSAYQPLDADLTSIAGLVANSGILRKTAANTWTLDTNTYLTNNQSITVSGDASGSGATAISLTVGKILGISIPAASTGNLRYNGSVLVWDATSYLTGNQSITWTPSGDVSGSASGVTAITPALVVTGIQGKSITLSTGFLKYNGTAWAFDNSSYQPLASNLTTLAALGNPGANGYVLSSTTAGVMSWVPVSGGGGTVTSVALTAPSNFTVSNSPVTTNGNISFAWNGSNLNFVLADGSTVSTSTYVLASTLSSYLTTANASSTYLTISNAATTYQPLDGDLTSIAGLSGTSGIARKTAANAWTLDTSSYLTTNQSITWTGSGDVSGSASGATSISPSITVTGIQGKGITLANGLLRYNGTVFSFDNSTFLTTNQSITLSGDVTGSGTTAITTAITATTITGKVLTGYSVGSNALLAATDTILTAFGKIQAQITATPGTVTSVGITVPSIFTASGSPVTNSGSLSFTWNGSSTNFVLADGTTIASSTYALASALSSYLTTAAAASGYQPLDGDLTSIASLVGTSGLARKTAANTWTLDTAVYLTSNQSINWTASGDISGSASGTTSISPALTVTGIQGKGITLANGFLKYNGTAFTFDNNSYQPLATNLTNLSILGNPSSNGYVLSSTTAGVMSWIPVVGGGGTVTSIALSTPSLFTVSGSPITTNGTLTFAWNGASTNFVLADGTTVATSTYLTSTTAASTYITIANAASSYQPLDGDLTSIAGLAGTSGWLKKTSANTWALDTSTFLTSNQSIAWTASGDISGTASGTTSIAPALTVTGVQGKTITLATGLLRYNGTSFSFDASTFLTSNQSITLSGDVSGSGSTAITVSVNKILGNTIPANAVGSLTNNGSGSLSFTPMLPLTGGTVSGQTTFAASGSTPATASVKLSNAGTGTYVCFTDTSAATNEKHWAFGRTSGSSSFGFSTWDDGGSSFVTPLSFGRSGYAIVDTYMAGSTLYNSHASVRFSALAVGGIVKSAATTGALAIATAGIDYEAALGNPSVNGYVLSSTTSGVRYWIAPGTGGMTNPLTTTGDMIYSSSGTTPARLAIGTSTQVLIGGTIPTWSSSLTLGGKLTLPASISGSAYLNLPHGTLPTTLSDGDLWTTANGAFARISGATTRLNGSGLYYASSSPVTVANTTTVTAIISTTLNSSAQTPGNIIDVSGDGTIRFASLSDSVTFTIVLGSTTIGTFVLVGSDIVGGNTATDYHWHIAGRLSPQTGPGTSSSLGFYGAFIVVGSTASTTIDIAVVGSGINTTVSNVFLINTAWSAAAVDDSLTANYMIAQQINAVGGSGGAVISVGLTAPSLFSVTGSPVTSSGNLTFAWNGSSANIVRADGSTVAQSTFQAANASLSAFAALGNPSTSGYVLSSTTSGALSWIAVGSGSGSVTSVALSAPSLFTVSGSPVTSTGTLSFAWNGSNTNFVLADGTAVATSSYLTTTAAGSTYQPLDGDLTSIASLVGTSGLARKTAANTWTLDTNTYLTANQTITLSGVVTGSGTTSITTAFVTSPTFTGTVTLGSLSGTLIGTSGVVSALSGTNLVLGNGTTLAQSTFQAAATNLTTVAGYSSITKLTSLVGLANPGSTSHLQITSSGVMSWDTSTYLTANQSITLSGDASGTGTTAITVAVNKILGNTIPVNASGALTNNGSGTLSWTSYLTTAPTITLTGAVTGSGTGSLATTLSAGVVGLSNMSTLAANSVIGNLTGSSATPVAVSAVSTATASTVSVRDTNANLLANNHVEGYSTTATAASTTTLTAASSYLQYFTGTTTQTVALPVTSTLGTGFQFSIVNLSTGAVTVQSSGANPVVVLAGGTSATFTCVLASGTTAASWSYTYSAPTALAYLSSGTTVTVANTTAATSLVPSIVPFSVAAQNTGNIINASLDGTISFNNLSNSITFIWILGSTTMASVTINGTDIQSAVAGTTYNWSFQGKIVPQAANGASASVALIGKLQIFATDDTLTVSVNNAVTLNTTIQNVFNVTTTWSAASSGNSLLCHDASIVQISAITGAIVGPQGPAGSGMANPMTAVGDMIYGGTSGTATRLAVGAPGYDLVSTPSGSVAWQSSAFKVSQSPAFTYTNGALTRIDYAADGSYKTFTYSNGILTQVDYINNGVTKRKTLNYTNSILTSIPEATL